MEINFKMGKYEFKSDLITGQNGETIVREHILSFKHTKLLQLNHDNKFDFMVQKKGITKTYEVKTEEFCKPPKDKGNLFIEIECRGKASGISVTQADWYVFYLPYYKQIWYIETEKLRELIETEYFHKVGNSGDVNSNTVGYLLPRESYRGHFKIYELG